MKGEVVYIVFSSRGFAQVFCLPETAEEVCRGGKVNSDEEWWVEPHVCEGPQVEGAQSDLDELLLKLARPEGWCKWGDCRACATTFADIVSPELVQTLVRRLKRAEQALTHRNDHKKRKKRRPCGS